MPTFVYDHAQITDWLGAHTVAKARPYSRAVSQVSWTGNTLYGRVQGTERRPYQVHVQFAQNEDQLVVDGECSCPVGYGCKHVAALLIAGLELLPKAPAGVRPELVQWLEAFRTRHSTGSRKSATPRATVALAYVIGPSYRGPAVTLYKAHLKSDGAIRALAEPWNNVEAALVKPMKFLAEEDLILLRRLWFGRAREDHGALVLRGTAGAELLPQLLATGRAFAQAATGAAIALRALRRGPPRRASLDWQPQAPQQLRCVLRTDPPASLFIATDPFWYVDEGTGEAGVLECPFSTSHVADLLSMPPISRAEAPLVGAVLKDLAPDVPPPPAHDAVGLRVIDTEPVPVLHLDSVSTYGSGWGATAQRMLDFVTVRFEYAHLTVEAHSSETLRRDAQGDIVQLKRRRESEQRRLLELRRVGLEKIPRQRIHSAQPLPDSVFGLEDSGGWPAFVAETLPTLRAAGWRCVMADEFRHNVIPIDAIEGAVRDGGDGWFDLDLGITVGERTLRLEPLLAELFRRDGRWLSGALEQIGDAETFDLKTDRGERLRLTAQRLKPLVRVLIDLFDTDAPRASPLRISRWDAGRLDALEGLGRWQFHGDVSIRDLAQRLRVGSGMRDVPVPRGLKAELREYQRQGLNWLQYLREHGLGGVLADDMGLGKTVQALAHLLTEQEAGRLDRPALIVVPTTLIPNWREEAARFAPSLKLLDLHGAARKDRFARIDTAHLVLTTYALLWRDHAALAEHEYHLLLLDESQYVKNAATKAASAIRSLRARHRLCLTGTPLENHLGELWAQFDFLLPGFLGTHKDFTRRWRTPIEKQADAVRRDLLARRIRPFMLRRRKDEVASELPPKTTIVRAVELDGAQRDLYETVRTAMQERVRAAISAQGLARSHLIVLDALLKLRQVCCDPRLVKLGNAQETAESSKLEMLLEMLPSLIAEGRRILLFSQFTSMLALIGAALDAADIGYVTLTGETTDRVTPVKRFAHGAAPVFLISLKAGGVGLNLTAADTVIHYDPWWNPAAENQATDRAHRIGQDKPVFVYKLVAAGSIEEKILALQDKKAALADAILSDDPAHADKFGAQDLEALFAPLPTFSASV
jgi:superfamily II DNA or RNA helicase